VKSLSDFFPAELSHGIGTGAITTTITSKFGFGLPDMEERRKAISPLSVYVNHKRKVEPCSNLFREPAKQPSPKCGRLSGPSVFLNATALLVEMNTWKIVIMTSVACVGFEITTAIIIYIG
jgi:hypothetical protein